MPFPLLPALLAVFLSGCAPAFFQIKENLSGGQILRPAVLRQPSGEKSWGLLPKYDEFLEGYIQGHLADESGEPLQGVTVRVLDQKGYEPQGFESGITDAQGTYRVKFFLPIHWGTVDFLGAIEPEGWKAITDQTAFRLYFNRSVGVLAYSPQAVWLSVRSAEKSTRGPLRRNVAPSPVAEPVPNPTPIAQPASTPTPASSPKPAVPAKKSSQDDPFSDFNFGP